MSVADESGLWVDHAEIPSGDDIGTLTISQAAPAARVITVDRNVVEVGGRLYLEASENRKFRRTIYPRCAPGGYLLAGRLAARLPDGEVAGRRRERRVDPAQPPPADAGKGQVAADHPDLYWLRGRPGRSTSIGPSVLIALFRKNS